MEIKFIEGKKIVSEDGTIRIIKDGKLHNSEGPALIPLGDYRKREYYINGIKYSEKDWKSAKRSLTGLPWYKSNGHRG